jgi:hypothetical protein
MKHIQIRPLDSINFVVVKAAGDGAGDIVSVGRCVVSGLSAQRADNPDVVVYPVPAAANVRRTPENFTIEGAGTDAPALREAGKKPFPLSELIEIVQRVAAGEIIGLSPSARSIYFGSR